MRLSRRRLRWMITVVKPWALGLGLIVSATASAGHDPDTGFSYSPFKEIVHLPHGFLDPRLAKVAPRIRTASLGDSTLPLATMQDWPESTILGDGSIVPRLALKKNASAFPLVDRSLKGDPLLILRRTLSRQQQEHERIGQTEKLLFGPAEEAGYYAEITPGLYKPADLAGMQDFLPFEHWMRRDGDTTLAIGSQASPQQPSLALASTPSAMPSTGQADGSSPAAGRAHALASATPAPADAVPVAIAAAPVSLPAAMAVQKEATTAIEKDKPEPGKSRFADLMDPKTLAREQRCLAEAVYFEARSEPESGQAAVAQVVLNRATSGLYPSSVCGVVYQNRHRYLACQFTFACEGKALRVTEPEAWQTASRIAKNVFEGRVYNQDVGGATHYHANYVRPYWARKFRKMDVIGKHIFYKPKPGQS